MHNFTYISQHLLDWSLQGYLTLIGGGFFWSIIFVVISVYIYLKNQSMVVWAISILILLAAFGNTIAGVGGLITFLHISIALVFTGLILIFVTKYRR
jgi:hypothetical protein